MESLRQKLYLYIEQYGALDPRTVALSQELDKHIIKAMREINSEYC
ncbi:aspartyl-phosphate phosphatase Spo0E family protein [Clostridium tunisiense]|nr:aspartyl-phosphate phosphatase Spo0E family protein [Clostridium tunisiense]